MIILKPHWWLTTGVIDGKGYAHDDRPSSLIDDRHCTIAEVEESRAWSSQRFHSLRLLYRAIDPSITGPSECWMNTNVTDALCNWPEQLAKGASPFLWPKVIGRNRCRVFRRSDLPNLYNSFFTEIHFKKISFYIKQHYRTSDFSYKIRTTLRAKIRTRMSGKKINDERKIRGKWW